jgi:hypothetical protein
MSDLTAGLAAMGVASTQIHTELFGAGPSITPGIAASPSASCRIRGQGPPQPDRWFRLPEAASMSAGGHRSRACSSWPRLATCRCGLHVERAFATPVRADLWRERSVTGQARSMRRQRVTC